MPTPLQSLALDRPGLPPLSPEKTSVIVQLLEPLFAPYDLTGVATAFHNLRDSLSALGQSLSGKPSERFAELLSAAESAADWLGRPADEPIVTLAERITLWDCVITTNRETADPRIFKAIGAFYFLAATGNAPASPSELRALFQAAVSSRSESAEVRASHTSAALIACSALVVKAIIQLQTRTLSRRSASTDMVEARVEKSWAGAYRFDIESKIEGQPPVRGLTPSDVVMTAQAVRSGAEAGSARLLLCALGHWFGVLPLDLIAIRIFSLQRGLLRIDPTSSFAIVRLGGVLLELARLKLPNVLVAEDELYLPLPAWISRLLRPLRSAAASAESLHELPGLRLNAAELRRLFCETQLPRRITAAKFVRDRTQPLVEKREDPIRIALAGVDLSRIHKVAAAYPHLTQSELLETLLLRSELLSWGELSPSPIPPHGYLSKVTPKLETVAALVKRLLSRLEASHPGNHAGIDLLLAHHNAFIHYTALMLAVGLLLRGQEATLVPASAIHLDSLKGFNDKGVRSEKAAHLEVCFGAELKHQFRYLKAHYMSLADRLEGCAKPGYAWIPGCANELRRVADGAHDLPLLVVIENGHLQAFTMLDLVKCLGDAWVGKADAIRHAGPDILRAAGFSYAAREGALRHLSGAAPVFSTTSAWSRSDWFSESVRMQEALFAALRFVPHGGLIRSLPRTA